MFTHHADHLWSEVEDGKDVAVDDEEEEPADYTAPDG